MQEVDFRDFFAACKRNLGYNLLLELDPYDVYVKHGNSYLAYSYAEKKNGFWINLAVGRGLDIFREFIRMAKMAKIDRIGFATSAHNRPMVAVAKYFKSVSKTTTESYADGSAKVLHEIELNNTRFGGH